MSDHSSAEKKSLRDRDSFLCCCLTEYARPERVVIDGREQFLKQSSPGHRHETLEEKEITISTISIPLCDHVLTGFHKI